MSICELGFLFKKDGYETHYDVYNIIHIYIYIIHTYIYTYIMHTYICVCIYNVCMYV